MSTKLIVDAKAKRTYRKIINHYGAQLNAKLNAGKLSEDKFWFLQDKLAQWYDNYSPVIEVNDFSRV